MKISVLIVTLNSGNALIDTVRSTLAQTYSDLEIIVKDGGSSDGSLEKIPYDKRIRVLNCADSGIYDAMNQAVRVATGQYLIFMNCGDMFIDDHVLEKVAKVIAGIPEEKRVIFYGDCYTANRDSILRYPDIFDDYVCFTKVLCHQATIYPAQMLLERGFSLNYKIAADYEYYVHAYVHGVKLIHIPIVIAYYQGDGASESHQNRKLALQERKMILKDNFKYKRYKKTWIRMQMKGVGVKHFLVQQEWFYPIYKRIANAYYNFKV